MNSQTRSRWTRKWSLSLTLAVTVSIMIVFAWRSFSDPLREPAPPQRPNNASKTGSLDAPPLIPRYQPVPRGVVQLKLPTQQQQLIPPEIESKVAELQALSPIALPTVRTASTHQQFQAELRIWYVKNYLEGYGQSRRKDPRWDDAAVAFIEAAIELIVDHDLRSVPLPSKPLEKARPLVEMGRALVDGGCTDPLVLSLTGEMLAYIRSEPEAKDLLRRAIPEFSPAGYTLEVAYYSTLLLARANGDVNQHYDAADMIIFVMKHRPYDRLERRMLYQQFVPATERLQQQQAAQFAAALEEEEGLDVWLKQMLLGSFHARLATDMIHFYRIQAKKPRLIPESPEFYRIERAHAGAAKSLLLRAWSLDPYSPEPATELLKLGTSPAFSMDPPPRFWFDRVVAAQFDYLPAYIAYNTYLYRKGGQSRSYDALLAFGRECLATGRFDTRVPDEFCRAAIPTVRLAKLEQRLASYPTLFDEFSTWYQGYHQQLISPGNDASNRTLLLGVAWLYGRQEEVQQLLIELGNKLDPDALTALQIRLADIRRTIPGEPRPFTGHRGSVSAVAFVDRDQSLLSAGNDGSVRFWSCKDGKENHILSDDGFAAKLCVISPDEKYVALSGDAPEVLIWDVQARKLLQKLPLASATRALALNDSGILAVAGPGDSTLGNEIMLWRVTDGAKIATLSGHSQPVLDIKFSPVADILVSVAGPEPAQFGRPSGVQTNPYNLLPAELVVWDLKSDQAIASLTPFANVIYGLELSRNGKLVALAGQDWNIDQRGFLGWTNLVRVLRTDNWQTVRKFSGYRNMVTALAFLDGGRILAAGNANRTIRFSSVSTGEDVATFSGHRGPVLAIAATADSTQLATADSEGEVKLWNLNAGAIQSQAQAPLLEHPFERLLSVRTDPKGRYLISCDQVNGVTLWDLSTHCTRGRTFHTASVPFTYGFDISPDGTTLVTAGGSYDRLARVGEERGGIVFWDIGSGKISRRLTGEYANVNCVQFAPDGKSLASGGQDGKVTVWDLNEGKPWQWGNLKEHVGAITTLAFSPDGKQLVTGSAAAQQLGRRQNGSFRVWQLPDDPRAITQSLTSRLTRDNYGQGVENAAFSPRGERLLVSSDRTVDLWDTTDFEKRMSVPGRVVAFSPDGNRFAAGGVDPPSGVVIWDTATGKEIKRLDSQLNKRLGALSFTTDGCRILGSSFIGQVVAWDVADGTELTSLDD